MKCPRCNSDCDREEVDIGVGVQCSPWVCNNCGWCEDDELNSEFDFDFVEGKGVVIKE